MRQVPDPRDTFFSTASWLALFATAIVVAAFVLKEIRDKGYPWWARLIFLTLLVVGGHFFQSIMSWHGLPGLIGILLFPLLPGVLIDDYYYAFLDLQMSYEAAHDAAAELALLHTGLVWLVIGTLIFFWHWTRPTAYTFKYGDDFMVHPSPLPSGKTSRVTYGG